MLMEMLTHDYLYFDNHYIGRDSCFDYFLIKYLYLLFEYHANRIFDSVLQNLIHKIKYFSMAYFVKNILTNIYNILIYYVYIKPVFISTLLK